jgi:hypothetical protein
MRPHLAAWIALALFAALPAGANATPVTYQISYLPGGEIASLAHGWENVTLHDPAASFAEAAASAPVTLTVRNLETGGTQPLELLCTDVFTYYNSGGIYTLGQLSDTLHDPVKVGQIEALLQHGVPGATTAASAAALQTAVWEIQNEPGTSGYSVTGGQFYATGYGGALDPKMVADATADLQAVESGAWAPDPGWVVMQFEAVKGNPNQSFAYIARKPTPAPEPSTLALLGVGALALLTSRRRFRLGSGA